MAFIAVLCVLLLFIAALGQTIGTWRGTAGQPWYGPPMFCWGVFFLAVFVTWPTIKPLL